MGTIGRADRLGRLERSSPQSITQGKPHESPKAAIPTIALFAGIALIAPSQAQAYLDAGSASLIFQAVIGAVAAGTLFAKLYWRRLKDALGFAQPQNASDEETSSKS